MKRLHFGSWEEEAATTEIRRLAQEDVKTRKSLAELSLWKLNRLGKANEKIMLFCYSKEESHNTNGKLIFFFVSLEKNTKKMRNRDRVERGNSTSRPSYPSFPGLFPSLVLYRVVYRFRQVKLEVDTNRSSCTGIDRFFEPWSESMMIDSTIMNHAPRQLGNKPSSNA